MTTATELPRTEFAYEAIVEVGERRDLGASPLGHRYIIPIHGGTFEGPLLQGKVLPTDAGAAGGQDYRVPVGMTYHVSPA
jgi:Protein of unknown function (DUF3237)